ncbi:MAG: hypothetical protein AAGK14_04780 [Verrucomicrobiota bacterium]
MSIAIAVFALMPLVTLLLVGLSSNARVYEQSLALEILERVRLDRKLGSPLEPSMTYALPPAHSEDGPVLQSMEVTLLTDEVGNLVESREAATFVVNYTSIPPAEADSGMPAAHIEIAWPAQAPNPEHRIETLIGLP